MCKSFFFFILFYYFFFLQKHLARVPQTPFQTSDEHYFLLKNKIKQTATQ